MLFRQCGESNYGYEMNIVTEYVIATVQCGNSNCGIVIDAVTFNVIETIYG